MIGYSWWVKITGWCPYLVSFHHPFFMPFNLHLHQSYRAPLPWWFWLCCPCCRTSLWGPAEPYTPRHPDTGASDTTISAGRWTLRKKKRKSQERKSIRTDPDEATKKKNNMHPLWTENYYLSYKYILPLHQSKLLIHLFTYTKTEERPAVRFISDSLKCKDAFICSCRRIKEAGWDGICFFKIRSR